MNLTQLVGRLAVRGRSGRLAYFCWSLAVALGLFVLLFAKSLTNLEVFASAPKFDAVLGAGAVIALMVAGVIATRRLNDMVRKSRYLWIYIVLFMISIMVLGDTFLPLVFGLGIPIIWFVLLIHPSRPNKESDTEIEQSV